jgi:hypothetical protein
MAVSSQKPVEQPTRPEEIEEVFQRLSIATPLDREAILRPSGFEEPEAAPVYYAIRVSGSADLALGCDTLPNA